MEKTAKKVYEIDDILQMKIFDRFLLVQILCTFVGSVSNTIIHGFSPIMIFSFSIVILDFIIGIIMKKKNKPFLGAWILNIIHGFILFPIIIFKSGISAATYFIIVLVIIGYISKSKHRLFNIIITYF